MFKVFLDMDGVLADFDGGLEKGYGIKNCPLNYQTSPENKTPEQWELVYKIRKCMATPGFFENLPMMEGAERLWTSVGTPYILSAVPGQGSDEMVAKEKRNWLTRVFGELPEGRVITCLRSEKVHHAVSHNGGPCQEFGAYDEPNILVDDIEDNCKAWERAGGLAIHFKNIDQAVKDLNAALGR